MDEVVRETRVSDVIADDGRHLICYEYFRNGLLSGIEFVNLDGTLADRPRTYTLKRADQ